MEKENAWVEESVWDRKIRRKEGRKGREGKE